jgi:hypothetical protein
MKKGNKLIISLCIVYQRESRDTNNVVTTSAAFHSPFDLRITAAQLVTGLHDMAPTTFDCIFQTYGERFELLVCFVFVVEFGHKIGIELVDSLPKSQTFLANSTDTVLAGIEPGNTEMLVFFDQPIWILLLDWLGFWGVVGVVVFWGVVRVVVCSNTRFVLGSFFWQS